jgi:hypothetical protein
MNKTIPMLIAVYRSPNRRPSRKALWRDRKRGAGGPKIDLELLIAKTAARLAQRGNHPS